MQVTIQIEQNLVKHFSFKQKFLLFLFINNNNNNNYINIYQKQFLHDQELKEGLRMPREEEKVGRRQGPDHVLVFLPVTKRLKGKSVCVCKIGRNNPFSSTTENENVS